MNDSKKIDFISDLLAHKKISVAEKERILLLTKEEIKKICGNDVERLNEIVQRLEKLEEGNNNNITATPEKPIKKQINIGNPKHVADFMSLFNKRDGLKYLTHDYDENDDFKIDAFLIEANKVFTNTTKKISIPNRLWQIVNQFAFNNKQDEQIKWTSISADYEKPIYNKIGWASEELQNWSRKNNLHPIKDPKYKKIISDFRRITRIEPRNLDVLINKIIDKIFNDCKHDFYFDLRNLEKADFYTHVGNLKEAIECIFEEIKERTDNEDKRKIKIDYSREAIDDYFVRKINITHYNSFPPKELTVLLHEWLSLEKGNMGKIGQKLQGYCHWSVKTNVDGKPVKVNILRDKDIPEFENIEQNEIVGFTHELTFYYK